LALLSSKSNAVEGIVEKKIYDSTMYGGETMKVKKQSRGQAIPHKRSLSRGSEPFQPGAGAPPPGHRILTLLGERGSALVEMALIMPMLLVLTTGIFVFGIAMNNYVTLTNAVSTGARTVALNAQLTTDPCAVASSAIEAAAPGLTSSKFTFSYTFNGSPYSGTSCNSSSVDTGAAGNLASGSTVTVTATYPLNLSVFGTQMSPSNAVLQATSTELVQ
jgi:Flp pilus assembly protein TadG